MRLLPRLPGRQVRTSEHTGHDCRVPRERAAGAPRPADASGAPTAGRTGPPPGSSSRDQSDVAADDQRPAGDATTTPASTPPPGTTAGDGRVVVYGGTFDPPTVGHVAAARALLRHLCPDVLRVVPAGDPWMKRHRNDLSPAWLRAAWCTAAFAGVDERIVVDLQEVTRAAQGQMSTTAATVGHLHQAGVAQLTVAVGTDTLPTMSAWKDVQRWLPQVSLAVLARPGHPMPSDLGELLPAAPRQVQVVPVDGPAVSSTQVRAALSVGQPVGRLVPPPVVQMLGVAPEPAAAS